MDERVLQLRVGLFVLLAMVILGFLIWLNSEVWKGKYTIFVKPQSAPGVTKNTPVRKNGIRIGRVASVQTQDDHVVLTLHINNDESIYGNESCQIRTGSLLGDAVVEILPLPRETRGPPLAPKQMIETAIVKRDPLDIVSNLEGDVSETLTAIRNAAASVEETGNSITAVTTSFQEAMGNEEGDLKKLLTEFRQTSEKASAALDNFNRMFENLNEIVGDPETKTEIRNTIKELPEIFREFRETIGDTRKTINSFQDVSGSAGKNLQNLESFTEALKTDGPEILRLVNAGLSDVEPMIADIRKFTQSLANIQQSKGSLGKLLNESDLYDALLETVENVRDLSVRLEPLLNDLRYFADSIARDPRQLGVRGALDRSPAGYKGSTTGRDRVIRH